MDDKTIDRVRKLLKLARNNPNVNEASVAFARAQEIATRAGLDIEDLPAEPSHAPPPDLQTAAERKVWTFNRNVVHWIVNLASGLARANSCDIYYTSRSAWNGATITAFGQPNDLDTVRHMLTVFVHNINAMARDAVSAYRKRDDLDPRWDESPRNYGSAWRMGCVAAICQRLKPPEEIVRGRKRELEEAAQAGGLGSSTALVRTHAAADLVERKAQIVADARKRMRLRSGAASSAGRGSARGYAAGHAAGSKMTLGGGKALSDA